MTSSSGSADARLRVETIADSETTWIVIQGEADMSNVNQLDATLSGIQLDGSRFVRIEASGLAFFDVATLNRPGFSGG
jgi:anti-anti-sigma regulatory factor